MSAVGQHADHVVRYAKTHKDYDNWTKSEAMAEAVRIALEEAWESSLRARKEDRVLEL